MGFLGFFKWVSKVFLWVSNFFLWFSRWFSVLFQGVSMVFSCWCFQAFTPETRSFLGKGSQSQTDDIFEKASKNRPGFRLLYLSIWLWVKNIGYLKNPIGKRKNQPKPVVP